MPAKMSQQEWKKKIDRLESELKEAKASMNKAIRKERNNQLIALGIIVEQRYKYCTEEERKKINNLLFEFEEKIDPKIITRAKECFTRILNEEKERTQKEKNNTSEQPADTSKRITEENEQAVLGMPPDINLAKL